MGRSLHTQRHRSGHNRADLKFLDAPAVLSAENVRRTGLCAGSDFTISYRSCVFFLHFSKCSINIKDTWRGIEVVITGLTRNHVSTLEVQTAEKPVTMRVCGQVQIVNWGLFYPVVLPNFHGLNFAGKWL